jgi:hypothetical protein
VVDAPIHWSSLIQYLYQSSPSSEGHWEIGSWTWAEICMAMGFREPQPPCCDHECTRPEEPWVLLQKPVKLVGASGITFVVDSPNDDRILS